MADVREDILARLVTVCAAVPGITAVARNRLDQNLARPAIIILDGVEQLLDAPPLPLRSQAQQIQRMELTPAIIPLIRGNRDGGGADAGSILSLYRSRIVAAVLRDATLADLVGTTGRIRYEGMAVAPPDAEGREYRGEITMVFTYIFRLTDAEVPLALPVRVEYPASGATIVLLAEQYALRVATGPLDSLTVRLPPYVPVGGIVEISFALPVADLVIQDAAGEAIPEAPTQAYGPGSAQQFRYVDTTLGWIFWK